MREFSGRVIYKLRTERGLRREHLGVAVNRSALTIRAYERDTVMPPADVVGLLADALGVPVDAFYKHHP